MITKRKYGQLPNGDEVYAWTMIGKGGLEMEVITFGGIVTRLMVPDSRGRLDDVVMGLDCLEDYQKDHPYFGAIVGRVAGRIPQGTLPLEGKVWQLPLNDKANHLHGGERALDKKNWQASPVDREDGYPSLALTYISPDGEEGYPGEVALTVVYTITDENTFRIDTVADSDRPTPVSLTHHGYFNLAGHQHGSISEHHLQIHASEFIRTDEDMTLSGERTSVHGLANDFREPAKVGSRLDSLWQKHGDLYWIGNHPEPVPVARMEEPESGRVLEVSSTNSCVQFYTGVNLDGTVRGKSGALYRQWGAFCLECEDYPDALKHKGMGDILARPGNPLKHSTLYAFRTKS